MGIIAEQSHLTNPNPDLEQLRRRTVPGMAHFAGTGPKGKTCRECSEWTGCGKEAGYYAPKGAHGGLIKPRSCDKYRELMRGDIGEPIPPDTMACKYFDPAIAPPALVSK
jgi:hypothetical protein